MLFPYFKQAFSEKSSEGIEKIKDWVEFYNKKRPHRSIEMLTPSKAYQLNGDLKRMWKNYHGKKILSIS